MCHNKILKNITSFVFAFSFLVTLFSCERSGSQTQQGGTHSIINENLSADEFEKRMNRFGAVQLLDVRTAGEFSGGYITRALNFDINSPEFNTHINTLDKNKPVFVYCLSGGRSASAASILEQTGFKEIYNLDGGLIKWNAKNKPLQTESYEVSAEEMTVEKFKNILLKTEKYLLVDYNAEWCAPCRKMAPFLNKIAEEKKDNLNLLPIDADKNKSFLKQKGIESLPVLELYKNGKLVWKHEGAIEEQELRKYMTSQGI